MVTPLTHAYKALGVSVLGVPHANRIPGTQGRWERDMYLPGKKTIVMQPAEVMRMRRWRHTPIPDLAYDLWGLAHEFEHYRQERSGQPFNERQADVWGLHHLAWIAHRVGIKRKGLGRQQRQLLRDYPWFRGP
jgi:hypothetical protein